MMANQKSSPAPPPIPVLMVVRELASGGIERDVAKLALGFSRDRFIPYVAAFKPTGPRFDELAAAGIPVLHLDLTSILSIRALRAAIKMRRLVRDKGIQVVHAFDASAVFAVPIARLLRVPVVLSSMLGSRTLLDPKSQKLLAFTDKHVDAVVVNCEAMRTHLVNDWAVPRDHIEICYNGVDTREFYPDAAAALPEYAEASVVIGAVCVLRAEKNLTLLQEAFAKVRHLSPNPKLLIVGSGPELDKLKKNSERLRIVNESLFVPGCQQVAPFMRSMDIFVSCSYSEAFSNSILEAMACGCCVVGSRVGGTPELISDGVRGLLFASNDVNDLADKLTRLIQQPELRQKFGARAAQFAATSLGMDTNLARTGEIYYKFLRRKKVIA
jgi:glycosyltransferase involved in cell wall biosynthesis